MDKNEEKKMIYSLMKEIALERRLLTQQYFDLKEKMANIENDETESYASENKPKHNPTSNLAKEKLIQDDYYQRKNKTGHIVPFDRISKNVISILKQSEIPLSNKTLFENVSREFETRISYSNLTCNVLPRMHNDTSIPVERAYRGYWQYRR